MQSDVKSNKSLLALNSREMHRVVLIAYNLSASKIVINFKWALNSIDLHRSPQPVVLVKFWTTFGNK